MEWIMNEWWNCGDNISQFTSLKMFLSVGNFVLRFVITWTSHLIKPGLNNVCFEAYGNHVVTLYI